MKRRGKNITGALKKALADYEQLQAERAMVICLEGLSRLPEKLLKQVAPYFFDGKPRNAHRPTDAAKRQQWIKGALVKAEHPDWSWGRVAQKADPDGFKQDQRRATDRIRQGVTYLKLDSVRITSRRVAATKREK